MKYFARVPHDPWRWGLNAWVRSSVRVLYSVASTLQDFIASNTTFTINTEIFTLQMKKQMYIFCHSLLSSKCKFLLEIHSIV